MGKGGEDPFPWLEDVVFCGGSQKVSAMSAFVMRDTSEHGK